MAYTNINKLRLILDIQNIFNKHKEDDVTTVSIWRDYIYPVYFISCATFYNYLATPARKLIREYEQKEQENTAHKKNK